MSAVPARHRVDTDALRSVVPIAAALRHFGIAAPKDTGRARCPVHAGENGQALSYDATHWHCFVCQTGGDVFSLVMAAEPCDFRAALRIVAELAGVADEGLPRIEQSELARRQTIARRRAALERWRNHRLLQWLTVVDRLERDTELLGRFFAGPELHDLAERADRWRLLESAHHDLERAEWMAFLFARTDEREWATLWRAERDDLLYTPEDLA